VGNTGTAAVPGATPAPTATSVDVTKPARRLDETRPGGYTLNAAGEPQDANGNPIVDE